LPNGFKTTFLVPTLDLADDDLQHNAGVGEETDQTIREPAHLPFGEMMRIDCFSMQTATRDTFAGSADAGPSITAPSNTNATTHDNMRRSDERTTLGKYQI
jgi:hypothetical protein